MAKTKKSLGKLLYEAKILQEAMGLTKSRDFTALNLTIVEILKNFPNEVTLKLDTRRTYDWEDIHALLFVEYGQYKFRIPVPELKKVDPEIAKRIKKKMNTYPRVENDGFKRHGELGLVQTLYLRLVELDGAKPWNEAHKTEKARQGWSNAKEVSSRLRFYIRYAPVAKQLPDDFIIQVGKAFGYNFKFGFWRPREERIDSNARLMSDAVEMLRKDPSLVYDTDFWAELQYFNSKQYLNKGELFEAVGSQIASVGIWAGYLHLISWPDGSCFIVSGSIPNQEEVGKLVGGRFTGWYVATEQGWQKYTAHFGKDAEEALAWLVDGGDGKFQLVSYDLHGMNFNYQPKTIRTEGTPLPAYSGKVTICTEYSDGTEAVVAEDGSLLGIELHIQNYNGEGSRFAAATQAMQDAWNRSRMRELLSYNLVTN